MNLTKTRIAWVFACFWASCFTQNYFAAARVESPREANLLNISDPSLPAGGNGAVRILGARSGDKSITLHWEPTRGPGPYRVFRKDGDRFLELPGSPVQSHSFADLDVANGTSYEYRIQWSAKGEALFSNEIIARPEPFAGDDAFLEYVQGTAFDYFWCESSPITGLVRDRSQSSSPCSIAAVGFGLTALGIGIDHAWISREQGMNRALTILRTLYGAPQGDEPTGQSGYKGWFYHFLDVKSGLRFRKSELSSIDTALLLGGVIYVREYFDGASSVEREIRELSDKLLERVDWQWMLNGGKTLTMGWHPETGFIKARWKGYNEASILYLLGIGSDNPTRLDPSAWQEWTRTYSWKKSYGFSFIHFAPLFGHQYSACWIDFRNIADEFTAKQGITYFENSRRATLAQRAYAIENPKRHRGYDSDIWGLTACDGPGIRGALGYAARGAPPAENDDGTIAPTAAGSSTPFTPRESIHALRRMYDGYRTKIWCGYGFRDAFNVELDWWDPDVLGIDQGPLLIMIENYRTDRVWKVTMKSALLRRGLAAAGFHDYKPGPKL